MKLSRRGLIAGAVALPLGNGRLSADEVPRTLTVSKRTLEVKGRAASMFQLTGPGGRPGLDMLLGERFRVKLQNASDSATVVHWHGLTPPMGQDGVAMRQQNLVPPGQSRDYDFDNTRSGTHWMHSHAGLQEQQMLAAPLIVRETAEPLFDAHEHVVILHDFTFRDPQEILAELQGGGGGHASHAAMGHGSNSGMATVLNDIAYDAYLANDRTLDDPEVVRLGKGSQIRLRIINAAAASNMWIDLGGLEGEVIAVDGNAIQPVGGSLFPLAIAQRADVRIRIPGEGGAFPILFRPEGVGMRTGIVLATPGATILKTAGEGDIAPALDLSQERLYSAIAQLPHEPVTRTEMLMLTGGGGDYIWGLNGKSSMHDTIFTVRTGERIAVIMHNMTNMAHPMHLHGHYFKVVAIGNSVINGALRDVVLVPPGETVKVVFDADNPGTWPFHCHHAYHMNSGMMGTIGYTSAA
jgi:FtsP/CotA-like multicopper oxidase with cupredoxin domain